MFYKPSDYNLVRADLRNAYNPPTSVASYIRTLRSRVGGDVSERGGIRLEFAQFGHFDSFDVIRSMVSMASVADEDLPTPIATGLKSMYYVDSDVVEGLTYYYKVRVWRNGTSLLSDQINAVAKAADEFFESVTFLAHLNALPFTEVKGATLTALGTYALTQDASPVSSDTLLLNGGILQAPTANYFNFDGVTGKNTVEFYFKPSATQSGNGVMLNISSSGRRWSFMTTGGQNPTVWVYDGSSVFIQVPNKVLAGNWYHFAFTKDGRQTRLYINGQKVAEVMNATSGFTSCTIIMGHNGSSENFRGNLSDVRITVGVVRYTENFVPPSALHLHG